ncbi:MAG TPA: DUF4349 domain-containing protein [Thermoleophilaceae bacterium]|nr:DUF4349 domain-containing protein [Thermoleophilaceae bacterium]
MTTPETTVEAIDEALASGSAGAEDGELRRLQELALLLRDDAPDPEPGYAQRMAARRFAAAPRRRLALPVPGGRLPALGIAASALVALAVTIGVLRAGDGDVPGDGATVGGSAGLAEDHAAPPADAEGLATEPSPGGGIAPGAAVRRIERSAQLTLAAPPDEVAETSDAILAVADRHRGFVLSSETSAGEDPGGRFELRIPETRLRAALADLSGLATVVERSEQGRDVTRPYDDARDRLDEARSDRRGLLRRLERADADRERTAIRRRLRLVSAEIRALSTQFRDLRERVDFAVVSVTLTGDGEEGGATGAGPARDALDDAVASLEGSLALMLRAVGVLLGPAVLTGAALIAARALRRRRREAALS